MGVARVALSWRLFYASAAIRAMREHAIRGGQSTACRVAATVATASVTASVTRIRRFTTSWPIGFLRRIFGARLRREVRGDVECLLYCQRSAASERHLRVDEC